MNTKKETLRALNIAIDNTIIKGNWKEFKRLARLHKQLTK